MISEEYSKRIEADIELADALDDEEEEANTGEGPGNSRVVYAWLYHTYSQLTFITSHNYLVLYSDSIMSGSCNFITTL